MVDLVLAGDNAIVVGLVAASLPREQRAKVIMIGIVAATVLRVVFAVVTTQLLQIIGLTLAGGLLLLWVCWKLWREIRAQKSLPRRGRGRGRRRCAAAHDDASGPPKTMRQAVFQIVLADISMSLDNVLAVAGIAPRAHLGAGRRPGAVGRPHGRGRLADRRLLQRCPWLSYVGLGIIFYVA